MRALFFGTPAIAVPSLEALGAIAEIAGVVCQPDRPAGRGLELKAPPVKVKAVELGLEVVQPLKIRTGELAAWVQAKKADVAIVIAYGRILPKEVLDAPTRGCMNLHASLLPKYRGAAPITWAIANGESETGVCLMQMDEGMDTGPVYSRHAIAIGENTTADELAVELGALAALVVHHDVPRAVAREIAAVPQDSSGATTARILEKTDGRIDWSKPATAVHDHVRAMTSWPGAFTTTGGKTLKILATRVACREGSRGDAGTIVTAGAEAIEIACGDGSINVIRAQMEGRKPLAARELVAGRAVTIGSVLGMIDGDRALADVLAEMEREFPRFRIVEKSGSPLSRAIDVALRVVTLGGQREYMTHYHTVLGDTLYVPSGWAETPPLERAITLRHERVHLRQRRRYTFAGMTFLYLLPFAPVFLAYGRARIEWEAYTETLVATAEWKGKAAARHPAFRARIIEQFTGPAYGWMWPFRSVVEGWYDAALAEIDES